MSNIGDSTKNERIKSARDSFSGRLLTNRQFDDAITITTIIEREIQNSGSFKDKLGDYSYAFARSEKFDAVKAETILRDLFKERTGQSMNQMREDLTKREETISDDNRAQAYTRACGIADLMESGNKLSFNRAYAHQAEELAKEMGTTDACAKRLMREEFAATENVELFNWGKELDEQFYRPQIEAEAAERRERTTSRTSAASPTRQGGSRTYHRSRPGPQ